MNKLDEPQSGYVDHIEPEAVIGSRMTYIEVIRVTETNVIAKGRRYGRWWLIKGIRMDAEGCTALKIRLIKEFELQCRLQHPGIARAVGFEEIDGMGACIIMEWIEGETLAETLRADSLSAKDRIRIMHEVIDAVAHIHSRGVVHRDLKPANIMIRRSGHNAVIIDFGLADSDDYTELKYPAGTSGYISPEQMTEGGVHPSDDIYSLGVIMDRLCPEYRRLSRQCQLQRSRRIADATRLLKIFEQRQRRFKTTAITIAAVTVIALLITAVGIILSYQRDSFRANETIIDLKEQNSRNAGRIATLTDSLDAVNRKFNEAEQQRLDGEAHLAARNDALNRGRATIEAILTRFEHDSVATYSADQFHRYALAVNDLSDQLDQAITRYIDTIHPDPLTPQDIETIRTELYNYNTHTLTTYMKKWTQRFTLPQ